MVMKENDDSFAVKPILHLYSQHTIFALEESTMSLSVHDANEWSEATMQQKQWLLSVIGSV